VPYRYRSSVSPGNGIGTARADLRQIGLAAAGVTGQDRCMKRTRRWPVMLLVLLVTACGSSEPPEVADPPASPQTPTPGTTVTVDLDDRPFQLHVPESYDPAGGAALVLLLHGYTSNAVDAESYFRLTAESDRRGFLYAMPDGTTDASGDRFWNATAACCDFRGSEVDDSGYLRRLIDTVSASYPVDRSRVYVVGHSNGGFMAHRLACDHAGVVTAIVSLAGAATNDESQCAPERPVNVLQIHGTADTTIPFEGGANAGNPFPSVADMLGMWRRLNGCADQAETLPALDLDSSLPGRETTVTTYATGCRDGSRVELWSIEDGSHVPSLTPEVGPAIVDFLYGQ
jgi:polyhydroxybutyrate depolymerase